MTHVPAVLVIDMQNALAEIAHRADDTIAVIASLSARARVVGVPVVTVQHHDPGLEAGTPGWRIVPELEPAEGEFVIAKSSPDSFDGSDLDAVLRSLGVTELLVTGFATEICVDTTARQALSRGYDLVLVEDGHTTSVREAGAGPFAAPDVSVAHHNEIFRNLHFPGRSTRVLPAAEVDFTPPRRTRDTEEAKDAKEAKEAKDAEDWEQRLAALWATLDRHEDDPAAFRAAIAELAAELSADDPVGLFERGAAHDSTGEPEEAVRHYRRALDGGLTGLRRRRAVVQLASSLRNLGRPDLSVELLIAEREIPADRLDADELALGPAVDAFLALALADTGREREAASLALGALAPLLPRYNRSLAAYARALTSGTPDAS